MIKKIFLFLFSTRLMAIVMIIFAVSIASATFVESSFDTSTARALIYNAWWFELLLFIGIFNLLGVIVIHKLYRKEKLTIFILHVAFIFILAGAAITRFLGMEGYMHIREGETASKMITDRVYFSVSAETRGKTDQRQKLVYLSQKGSNYHKIVLHPGGDKVIAELLSVEPDAIDTIIPDTTGRPVLELVTTGEGGRQTIILSDKQTKIIAGTLLSFNDTMHNAGINFTYNDSGIMVKSRLPVTVMEMLTQKTHTQEPDKYYPFLLRTLYNFNGFQLVGKSFVKTGRIGITPSKVKNNQETTDALLFKISAGGEAKTLLYMAGHSALNNPVTLKIKNISVSVTFGAKSVSLPFSLSLNKFILERYPGSNSPSWFESKIQLTDKYANVDEEHRIFMNNVLRYGGYRFYQSSYDTDEKGTILSVNKDYWGTIVTYFGYLLLAGGIITSLFNRKSRFRKLSAEVTRLRNIRKSMSVTVIITFITYLSFSANVNAQISVPDSVYINKRQASDFGKLLIQDPGGRIKPLNSLSSEIIRKVSRSTKLLGLNNDQIFLGMLVYPEFWQKVPMIKITNPDIKKLFHITDSYIAFVDILDTTGNHNYLLAPFVKEAYQKKPAIRSKFDTEIIRLDERINLCYMVYTGEVLRVFPKMGDPNKSWYTPVNAPANFSGNDSLFVNNIIPLYFNILKSAGRSNNYGPSSEALDALHNYQYKFGGNTLPSAFRVNVEIFYNKLDVFERLGALYGIIGFVLLLFQFVALFLPGRNFSAIMNIGSFLIIVCFIVHIAGLTARWYISGHAPWSNAYESLTYIAFATMAAGLIFSRKSGITLSATALLAWLILFVAHLNWMDPEITNLVPVLKSYWLVIHVAIITASYGFLALGALLALINLLIMIFQNPRNINTSGIIIAELIVITEMTLIIGLYMLSIGTFLGGVWANESWGRYWGWDAKETWALVSVMVYAFILHMRMVPGLKSSFLFNVMALLGFSSVIMTYFGVNYFLAGLHSYAKGDSFPIPIFVYYSLAVAAIIIIMAWLTQRSNSKIPIN